METNFDGSNDRLRSPVQQPFQISRRIGIGRIADVSLRPLKKSCKTPQLVMKYRFSKTIFFKWVLLWASRSRLLVAPDRRGVSLRHATVRSRRVNIVYSTLSLHYTDSVRKRQSVLNLVSLFIIHIKPLYESNSAL